MLKIIYNLMCSIILIVALVMILTLMWPSEIINICEPVMVSKGIVKPDDTIIVFMRYQEYSSVIGVVSKSLVVDGVHIYCYHRNLYDFAVTGKKEIHKEILHIPSFTPLGEGHIEFIVEYKFFGNRKYKRFKTSTFKIMQDIKR